MTDSGPPPANGPLVCPFVALAEDRDRRADSPDEGNRCYAERAPRQRDMVYQADYCYSARFSQCSVFLGWAARNAAEPAFVSEAAQKAWGSGITAPGPTPGDRAVPATPSDDDPPATPTPEGGLFGTPDARDPEDASPGREQLDWVAAGAWAEVPWDDRAELEADELETLAVEEPEEGPDDSAEEGPREEATEAPKVPAAVPTRRRKRVQPVIRSRGSGEWFYADPPGHEPLVKRRYGITPPILLAVLGLLVAALVVFMIPTLFFGGGDDDGQSAALPSPSSGASVRPRVTRAPVAATALPSADPTITPKPNPRFYRVKSGDSLTGIATRFGVKPQHLQCINNIKNKNIVVLGARYEIPPEGFSCPPNWRNATPEP